MNSFGSVVAEPQEEGWTVVKTNRKPVLSPAKLSKLKRSLGIISDSAEAIVNSVVKTSKSYSFPSYLRDLQFESVIALGIGSFGNSYISKAQLLVLHRLITAYRPTEAFCYDPVLTVDEKKALHQLGMQSSLGSSVPDHSSTLFFMPHCDKSLYLDILKQHRRRLSNLHIIGNDFRIYALRSTGEEGKLWTTIAKYTRTRGFHVTPALPPEVLSDTVFTSFPEEHATALENLLS